jgi:putative transcriptional regulator
MKALKIGAILLAEPFMLDPNFKRAAVFMCDHGKDGSIGFVINRPLNHRINSILEDFPDFIRLQCLCACRDRQILGTQIVRVPSF